MSDTDSSVTETPPPTDTPPVASPTPPTPPPTSTFDPGAFMTQLDEKMTAWSERITNNVKEAFPAAPADTPPADTPPKDETPPKAETPPTDNHPKPGKKTFGQWWFGS